MVFDLELSIIEKTIMVTNLNPPILLEMLAN